MFAEYYIDESKRIQKKIHDEIALKKLRTVNGNYLLPVVIALYLKGDENHIFTKIPLLASIQTLIAKVGRKLGLWLWLATQNLKDFAGVARKMLAMIETWMCLALPPDEIDQIERLKPLTPEQRKLFLSAKK